jgi:poly(A) polymerase
MDEPTQIDLAATYQLLAFLQEMGEFATPEEENARVNVLYQLNLMVKEFVKEVYMGSTNEQAGANSVGGSLVTFGSFRLGVAGPGSDIDTLCLVPRLVKRPDFFSVFYRMLLNNSQVKNLIKIEEARVPIMTMQFQDIDIDISFAQLALSTIDESLDERVLEDDTILADVDPQTTSSLNGVRVSNMILKLVPNCEAFRLVLRFIKIWARERGIYGNVYGYLGGVNCALLCAFICQRYPKATASTLIVMFFQDLSYWNWAEPIYINTPSKGPRTSWDNSPGSIGRREVMPIITPAYPAMNSMANATRSTRNRMVAEFKRGYKLVQKVLLSGEKWGIVTAPTRFFTNYPKYVEVDIWATTKEDYGKWVGVVESRVRKLAQSLEIVRFMDNACCYPDHFDRPDDDGHEFAGCFFIGIAYSIPAEESISRRIDISEPCQKFINETYAHRLRTDQMFIFVKLVARQAMPDFLFPGGRPMRKAKH